MAVTARYTHQMPFVGTQHQAAIIAREAERRGIAKAAVVREAFDEKWGLVDGEPAPDEPVPEGQQA